MPFLGLLPFLPVCENLEEIADIRINALSRASSISTKATIFEAQEIDEIVSMPFLGLLPFLLTDL